MRCTGSPTGGSGGYPIYLLIVTTEFPPGPGGIGCHAFQLAEHLSAMGWTVHVAAPSDYADGEQIRRFDDERSFSVHRYKPSPNVLLRQANRLVTVAGLLARRPDVVVATGDRACYLVCLLTRLLRRPWISVQHGRLARPREMPLKRWMLRRAHTVVHVSDYTRRKVIAAFGADGRHEVIHNGADAERFSNVSAELPSLDLPPGRLLLTVGNVTRRKGQETVIRALPSILEQVPETQYLMAGLPTDQQSLSALAQELGVQDRVHFLGKVDDHELEALLTRCDIFVMTSRHAAGEWEGFGIAVVEAAMCGMPAVVTGPSGLAEAVVPGETGEIVPENDPAATADAIVGLLIDDQRRRSMGQRARERALTQLTWKRCAERFHTLLRELAG